MSLLWSAGSVRILERWLAKSLRASFAKTSSTMLDQVSPAFVNQETDLPAVFLRN